MQVLYMPKTKPAEHRTFMCRKAGMYLWTGSSKPIWPSCTEWLAYALPSLVVNPFGTNPFASGECRTKMRCVEHTAALPNQPSLATSCFLLMSRVQIVQIVSIYLLQNECCRTCCGFSNDAVLPQRHQRHSRDRLPEAGTGHGRHGRHGRHGSTKQATFGSTSRFLFKLNCLPLLCTRPAA